MNTKTIQFRGQTVVVIEGSAMPEKQEGMHYYGIRSHQTENMPLSVEKLVVFGRWGTIVAPNPIHMDVKSDGQLKCDRTNLTLDEVMELMGYKESIAS